MPPNAVAHLRRITSPARRRRARFFDRAAAFTDIVIATDHRGNRFAVRTDDRYIGRELFISGAFEAHKQANAVAALRDRGIEPTQILDIGANIGTTMIELLSLLPDATAIAFEPEHTNFQLLAFNTRLNDLSDRAQLLELALGDSDGELEFELAPDNRGDHRVRTQAADGDFGEQTRLTTTVAARRLDGLVAEGIVRFDQPSLAFVDVQGFEGHLLSGGRTLIEARVPLAIEFWPYGLRRCGGFEALLAGLEEYDELLDITDEPRVIRHAELRKLAGLLTGHADHRDLLALTD